MRIKIKRFLSILLTLAMVIGLMPGMSLTAYAANYDIWVGGTQVTSENCDDIFSDGKASYDYSTHTLILNGYSYAGTGHTGNNSDTSNYIVIYSPTSTTLNININGTNSLTQTGTGAGEGNKLYGIYALGNITISGDSDSTLSVTTSDRSDWGSAVGIYSQQQVVIINSGSIRVNTGEAKNGSFGINSNVTWNGGSLTAQAKKQAIPSGCSLTVNNGGIITAGDDAASAVVVNTYTDQKYLKINSFIELTDSSSVTIMKGSDVLSSAPIVDDILTANCSASNLTYQWYRGDDEISGATGSSYTVTVNDVGKTIKVIVTQAADAGGSGKPATTMTKASSATSAVVKKTATALTSAETAGFVPDYTAETFTIGENYEVSSTNGDTVTAISNLTTLLDSDTPVIYLRSKETTSTLPSGWLSVNLVARPDAPTGLTTESATNGGTADGKIKGVTTAMEYSADNGTNWTNVTANPVNVIPGTYQVRVKATSTMPHSKTAEVTVGSNYTSLDTTPIIIKKGENALSGAPVVGDVLTVSCDASDLTYEWFVDGVSKGEASASNTSYTVSADDAGKTIKVKATQIKNANGEDYTTDEAPTKDSAVTSAVVKKTPEALTTDDAKTNAGISYLTESVSPATGYEVSSSGTEYVAVNSLTNILNDSGTPKIYVRKAETDDTAASTWVEVTLTSRPDAPTGLTTDSATSESDTDGKINGVSDEMEYSSDDGATWTNVSGDPLTVKSGDYLVRTKATNDTPASRTASVTVGSKQIVLSDSQKPFGKTGLRYDGSAQKLVDEPSQDLPVGTVEMQYALGNDDITAPTSGWSTSIPTATDAGTYYVWYKAVGDADHNDSDPGCETVTISVPEVVATPTFTPVEGTYTEAQSITITCATEGATIHYTTDGNDPTASSTTYSSAISVGETTTIKAIAVKDGMTNSEVASVTYTINIPKEKVATPTFTPAEGTYTEAQSVTITCATEGATIHYTTDGNDPTSSSTTYSSAISVGETTTIKAIAVKDGMTDSDVASAEYTINITPDTVATPTFSPDAGEYEESTSVSISCATEGATIHYTTDGTLPVVGSSIYTSPITVHETTTIKAIGVKEGMTDSSVASATYTISEKPEPGTVATPKFSPEGGTYSDPQMVSINSETSGATIYYTTDGNDPTKESTPYSSEITVTETTTIKAIAVKEGMTDSSVASVTYTISEEPEPEPSEDTKVDVGGLSDGDITDDLKGQGYDSVASIETALETALSIETAEQKQNSELVDAKLMVSNDGGATWSPATPANFPAGGIDVLLPYPAGTNGNDYSFSVAHMIGTSANGKTAGDIETPGTTNTSSGIRTHFNGLSPVLITWTKKSSPSGKNTSEEEKAHTHHYVWETIEATEENDGELRYVCDVCGAVQTRVPITAYYVFNKNTTEKIRKAVQGTTVKIETSKWISFHKMVIEALRERPDVTLEISFLSEEYKGDRYVITIPAGSDLSYLIDENGFVGFLYLGGKYGIEIR